MWLELTKPNSSTLRIGEGDRREFDDLDLRSAAAARVFLAILRDSTGRAARLWASGTGRRSEEELPRD